MSIMNLVNDAEKKAEVLKVEAKASGKTIVEEAKANASIKAKIMYDDALIQVDKMKEELEEKKKELSDNETFIMKKQCDDLSMNASKHEKEAIEIIMRRFS